MDYEEALQLAREYFRGSRPAVTVTPGPDRYGIYFTTGLVSNATLAIIDLSEDEFDRSLRGIAKSLSVEISSQVPKPNREGEPSPSDSRFMSLDRAFTLSVGCCLAICGTDIRFGLRKAMPDKLIIELEGNRVRVIDARVAWNGDKMIVDRVLEAIKSMRSIGTSHPPAISGHVYEHQLAPYMPGEDDGDPLETDVEGPVLKPAGAQITMPPEQHEYLFLRSVPPAEIATSVICVGNW